MSRLTDLIRQVQAKDPQLGADIAGGRHADMTRAVLRGYELDEEDQTHAVRLLGSVFHGFVTLELAGAFTQSNPVSQESWSRALDALEGVLRNWSAPTTTVRKTS